MRLSQIRHILSKTVGELQSEAQGISNNNVELKGVHRTIEAAKLIQSTGILLKETSTILNFKEVSNSALDEIVVHHQTATSFITAQTTLLSNAKIVLNTLEEFIGEESPDSISIKLPTHKDIDKIAKNLINLKVALEQALVHDPINGRVELVSFERGSNWLEIYVGGATALSFIGGILKLIYASREKEIELEGKREMIRHIKVQNDAKEAFYKAIDKELEDHYSMEVGNLLSENGVSSDDKEYPNRLGHSLRLLSELISEGLEIHPTLIASDSAISAFPDPQILVNSLGGIPEKLIGLITKEDTGNDKSPAQEA